MKPYIRYFAIMAVICVTSITGCAQKEKTEEAVPPAAGQEQRVEEISQNTAPGMAPVTDPVIDPVTDTAMEPVTETKGQEPDGPAMETVDWSNYFNGLNGAAVFYDAAAKQYNIYGGELAYVQRPPCSTFKIISSLIGLENGIIVPGDSTRAWSGEQFWNEDWNKDIDFEEAFRTSCVWYYRKIIDEIGEAAVQNELDRLQYGNCDISDWEGRLNTNNNNRALTGFWLESSLKISALEQVQAMEQIFGEAGIYKQETIQQLKQVMLLTDYDTQNFIYGKTGMGKDAGVVVDAWYTGFVSGVEGNIYFCIYLGETDGADVSSAKAKEIAVNIITDCY